MRTFKVKILLASYGDYDERSTSIGITDWEEVTEQEYFFLRDNIFRLARMDPAKYGNGQTPYIVIEDEVPVKQTILSLRAELQKEVDAIEKRREDERLKKAEAKIKRDAKVLFEKKDALKKLLEEHPELKEELLK